MQLRCPFHISQRYRSIVVLLWLLTSRVSIVCQERINGECLSESQEYTFQNMNDDWIRAPFPYLSIVEPSLRGPP